jgi:hypothetical protein
VFSGESIFVEKRGGNIKVESDELDTSMGGIGLRSR